MKRLPAILAIAVASSAAVDAQVSFTFGASRDGVALNVSSGYAYATPLVIAPAPAPPVVHIPMLPGRSYQHSRKARKEMRKAAKHYRKAVEHASEAYYEGLMGPFGIIFGGSPYYDDDDYEDYYEEYYEHHRKHHKHKPKHHKKHHKRHKHHHDDDDD
ncbi:MAG: hypothetical protein Q4C34_09180 [Bacteroidales bacterium]|nr:hypothetical protein [Bacteroidales bacterium]